MSYLQRVSLSASLLSSPSAVCHEVPEEPVLSPVSGRVFEKRLVTKWVHDNGTDPVNGEPLSVEHLIAINGKEIDLDAQLQFWLSN